MNAGTSCNVHSTLHRTYRADGFCEIAQDILGKKYQLSIVLVGDRRARTLNKTHRDKTYTPNVLSFPLDEHSGEIFLNIAQIAREAKRFDLTPRGHAKYLLIHGCLHLKGYHHGGTMERAEKKLLAKFAIR